VSRCHHGLPQDLGHDDERLRPRRLDIGPQAGPDPDLEIDSALAALYKICAQGTGELCDGIGSRSASILPFYPG